MEITEKQIAELRSAIMKTDSKPKKFSFSKFMFVIMSLIAVSLIVFACIMMWRTGDTSAMAYLIPAAFGELATATGFYFNKAKKENEIKLRKYYGPEVYNDSKEGNYYGN